MQSQWVKRGDTLYSTRGRRRLAIRNWHKPLRSSPSAKANMRRCSRSAFVNLATTYAKKQQMISSRACRSYARAYPMLRNSNPCSDTVANADDEGLSGIFADTTIDPITGALLGRFIAEERDTQRLLEAQYEQAQSRSDRRRRARSDFAAAGAADENDRRTQSAASGKAT